MSAGRRMGDFFRTRYPIASVAEFLAKKTVPIHKHTLWYYFGGITLFLFVVQVVTGILLLLYYRPSADHAYESVKFIVTQVNFGWLIRSVHSWSANVLIAVAFVHMFSVFLLKAYRPPRELTWVTGALLFFLMLGFGFSGYLLPWNELAFFATKVGTDIAGSVPIVGRGALVFLRGGEEVTGGTLTRFFGFHVAVLPALATLLLLLHVGMVQVQGMSEPLDWASLPKEEKKKRAIPFFPNFLLRDAIAWSAAVLLLIGLASLFPWGLGSKADPFSSAPAGITPEWYFVFMFQTLKFIPSKVLFLEGEVLGICAFGLGGLLWLVVPFIDRPSAKGRPSPWATVVGTVVILYVAVMTILGYMLRVK
jgi:cytochrome b6